MEDSFFRFSTMKTLDPSLMLVVITGHIRRSDKQSGMLDIPRCRQMHLQYLVLIAGTYISHSQQLHRPVESSASIQHQNNQEVDKDPFVIAGYWPDYRTHINVQTSSHILTDIILFSIEPQASKSMINHEFCCIKKEQYAKAREARSNCRTTRTSMNLFVSIGGGGRSNAMREITANKERRMTFIRDLITLWYV